MTEQDPSTPTTPPETPQETPQATSKAKAAKDDDSTRYAVYDKTYLRFVGEVHKTKAAATKEAKDRKVRDFEIREV